MRVRRSLWGAAALGGALACNDATQPAVPIVNHQFTFGIGTPVASTGGVFFLATEDSTGQNFRLLIDTFPLTGPSVHSVRQGDSTFAQATARLSNGHRDIMEYGLRFVPNGGGLTVVDNDWNSLDRSPADPDLAAYALTEVTLVIDSAYVNSPGSDLNGDGKWTDAGVFGHLVIYGDSL